MAAAPAPAPSPPEASPPPLDASASASDDEWDADGFVIPDVTIQDDDDDVTTQSVPKARDPEPQQAKEEKIYLGPHGAPPSGAKQQQLNTVGRKQSFRNKLKEADRKSSGNAQENKVESLRQLMGAVTTDSRGMAKSSRRDWLDPHCHESEFDRKPR